MNLATKLMRKGIPATPSLPPVGSGSDSSIVSASDTFSMYAASRAFDGAALNGLESAVWCSGFVLPCWYQWNFGGPCQVSGLRYSTRNSTNDPFRIKDYAFYYSNSGEFTGEEVLITSGAFPLITKNTFTPWVMFPSPIIARYLRLVFSSGHDGNIVAAQEFQLM